MLSAIRSTLTTLQQPFHNNSSMSSQDRFLVWGAQGWIGGMLIELLKQQGKDVHGTTTRMHEQEAVRRTLDEIRPTHVINCAGKTGTPNVDWCESHKLETMESNGLGIFMVTYECQKRNIHCTVLATGCIYTSDYTPDNSTVTSQPFTEADPPNFTGSFYSKTKAPIETFLAHYPNNLTLRLRMPVSADLNRRSFVTKILNYKNIVNIPNSHSILPNLLPVVIAMSEHRETGVYNFTNPGSISHNEVLELYKEIVDSSTTWQNFSLEEQGEVIVAERSNCALDAGKLVEKVREYRENEGRKELDVPEIRVAYRRCFEDIAKKMGGEGVQQKGGAIGMA